MNSLVRIACIAHRVKPAVPKECLESITAQIELLKPSSPDIIVLPKLALSSGSLGHVYKSTTLMDECMKALDELCLYSAKIHSYIIVGLPLNDEGRVVSVCAVLFQGRVLGFVPSRDDASVFKEIFSDRILDSDTVFTFGNIRFNVLPCDPKKLVSYMPDAAKTGCDLLIVPSYTPIRAGDIERVKRTVKTVSESMGCAVCVANGGDGDTSSPYVFKSYTAVCECGEFLSFEESDSCISDAVVSLCDIDADIIMSQKKINNYKKPLFSAGSEQIKSRIIRPIRQNPYMPQDESDKKAMLSEMFELQVRSLVSRMSAVGIKKIVVGVSGGLDSTLALLTANAALKQLSLPNENLIGITMPGFGTSDRTYFNALALIEQLGAESRDISIKNSVLTHFEDIGHDPAVKDVTYENAQARERTQILFDVANSVGALVLGTGDLSEAALGWCTFNGDHMASYNVNICLTKTMVRLVTEYIAKEKSTQAVSDILFDILDTPVSPELLPSQNEEISQKTEDILGPYKLHDFFLYYFLKYGMRPTKMFYYACIAFSGELEPAFIKDKLIVFLRRFFSSQFKRSCAPDAADITGISFANPEFYMPSDCSGKVFIDEAEKISI